MLGDTDGTWHVPQWLIVSVTTIGSTLTGAIVFLARTIKAEDNARIAQLEESVVEAESRAEQKLAALEAKTDTEIAWLRERGEKCDREREEMLVRVARLEAINTDKGIES